MKAALQNYHARMQRVLDHIDQDLDGDLGLEALSCVAAFLEISFPPAVHGHLRVAFRSQETDRPLSPKSRSLWIHGLIRRAFWAGITDRVQHVANLGRRCIRGDACWRLSMGDIEGPLPCMRI